MVYIFRLHDCLFPAHRHWKMPSKRESPIRAASTGHLEAFKGLLGPDSSNSLQEAEVTRWNSSWPLHSKVLKILHQHRRKRQRRCCADGCSRVQPPQRLQNGRFRPLRTELRTRWNNLGATYLGDFDEPHSSGNVPPGSRS